jgi:DNA-binding HxlR family transcriptional regulator
MKDENEKVQTFLPDGTKGEYIIKSKYERWSAFILSVLDTEENFSLNDVLERARSNATAALHNEIAWNILQVKRDLEARGFIKSVEDPDIRHKYYLKLTRQGLSKLTYDAQVAEWLKVVDNKYKK